MKCPFCKLDPFEYVNVGVGSVPVAVNCCEYGYALYQLGEPYEVVKATQLDHRRRLVVEYFQRPYTEEAEIPF